MHNSPAHGPTPTGTVVWFLFLGGIAAGAYLLSALAPLFGRPADRKALEGSRYLPLPLVIACSAVTLGIKNWWARPELAALAAFSGFCLLAALPRSVLPDWPAASWVGRLISVAGSISAVVLVTLSTQLLVKPWIGPGRASAMLLASSASTGAAALVLSARWHRRDEEMDDATLERLGHWNAVANVVELGVLAPLLVVPVGLILPLLIGESRGLRGETDAALLTLFGGFVFCVAFAGIPASLSLR
jgi:hypothetical protein